MPAPTSQQAEGDHSLKQQFKNPPRFGIIKKKLKPTNYQAFKYKCLLCNRAEKNGAGLCHTPYEH